MSFFLGAGDALQVYVAMGLVLSLDWWRPGAGYARELVLLGDWWCPGCSLVSSPLEITCPLGHVEASILARRPRTCSDP